MLHMSLSTEEALRTQRNPLQSSPFSVLCDSLRFCDSAVGFSRMDITRTQARRGPKIARPMRTIVAPSSMATSKSSVMPMLR